MRKSKYWSLIMIFCLVLTIISPATLALAHEDSGSSPGGSCGGAISGADGGSGQSGSPKGGYGRDSAAAVSGDTSKGYRGGTGGGQGGTAPGDTTGGSDSGGSIGNPGDDSGTNEEDGSSGNSGDKKGGIFQGGQGSGGPGSGNKQGKPEIINEGTITLNVEVFWPEGIAHPDEVNVILNRDDVETVVRTVDGIATFTSEASGDCSIYGEDIPGFITPYKDISLTGDQKIVSEALEYVADNIPVTGVTLNVTELNLLAGFKEQLTATVEPLNANEQGVTWDSSNEYVATVDDYGWVTGTGSGTATITATTVDGGKTDQCIVTVQSIESLNDQTLGVLKDQLVILPEAVTAVMDDDVNSTMEMPVVWKDSSDAEVSTFKVPLNGGNELYEFTGLPKGIDNTITNLTPAVLTLNVSSGTPAVTVKGVTLDETALALYVGGATDYSSETEESHTLVATIFPENATTQNVIWTSSDPGVASVAGTGTIADGKQGALVTALSPGSAVITVETLDGNFKAYCQVSVALAPEIVYIFPTLGDGSLTDSFSVAEEVYINVENLITFKEITADTPYFVKVEQKGSSPLLGEGTVTITPGMTAFSLYQNTFKASDPDQVGFDLTSNYSNEYYVYMSESDKYPKNDELTLATNFKIGQATPTIPDPNASIVVTTEIFGSGVLTNKNERNNWTEDPSGIIYILCRELDSPSIEEVSWEDYYSGDIPKILYPNPKIPGNLKGVDINSFTDEVKLKGTTDGNGVVNWLEPSEPLKLGGYVLLQVTPKGYVDNLSLENPFEPGTLLKEVTIKRDGEVYRNVHDTWIGETTVSVLTSTQTTGTSDLQAADSSSDDLLMFDMVMLSTVLGTLLQ